MPSYGGTSLVGCLHSVGILISGFYLQFARWVETYRAPAPTKLCLTNQGMLPWPQTDQNQSKLALEWRETFQNQFQISRIRIFKRIVPTNNQHKRPTANDKRKDNGQQTTMTQTNEQMNERSNKKTFKIQMRTSFRFSFNRARGCQRCHQYT